MTDHIFIGQDSLVRRIFSRICADRPQSVSVISGPRNGKTVLLRYLNNEDTIMKFAPENNQIIFVYEQELCKSESPGVFFKSLLRALSVDSDDNGNVYNTVFQTIERHHLAGDRIVMLLDNFHLLTKNPLYELNFFSFLRSIANNFNVSYITTSVMELQRHCLVKEIQESPFFNIFSNAYMKPISLEPSKEVIEFFLPKLNENTIENLLLLFKGAPALIAAICGKPFKLMKVDSCSAEEIYSEFSDEIVPFFSKSLSLLPPKADKAFRALQKGKSPDEKEIFYISPLIKQGYLQETEKGITFFNKSFEIFIKYHFHKKMLLGI